jgi:hypothetical protein
VWLTWLTGRSDPVGYARYLEPVADAPGAGRGARDRRRPACHRCSGLIGDHVPARSPGSALSSERGRVLAPRWQPRTPSAPIAGRGRWRGHRARPSPRRRNVAALPGEGARQQRLAAGPALATGEDRSCRRTARQAHVAHANVLVRGLFRGWAQDNRDDVRVCLPAQKLMTIRGRSDATVHVPHQQCGVEVLVAE